MNQEDPQEYRDKNMCCETCIWYAQEEPTDGIRFFNWNTEYATCRFKSPVLGGWPVLYLGDWCGDHKLDEDKVSG